MHLDSLVDIATVAHKIDHQGLIGTCVEFAQRSLTMDSFVDIALLADRMNHQGLLEACVAFALRGENRWACLRRTRVYTKPSPVSAATQCGVSWLP